MKKEEEKKKLTVEEEAELNEKLLDYKGPDEVVPASTIYNSFKGKIKPIPVQSKIAELDSKIGGGFFPGQLITISGPTGRGKTTLLRTFTKAFCEQGAAPLWMSYEETYEQFLSKLPESIYDAFYMPLELIDKKPWWIEQRILESKLKYGTKIVMVDHLHFLIDFYMRNTSLEIGAIIRALKILAIRHRIIFFLIAHVGKIERGREFEQGYIRDSAMIEAESDMCAYVWRTYDEKNKVDNNTIKVTKNREGGVINFKIPMYFNMIDKMLYPITDEKE